MIKSKKSQSNLYKLKVQELIYLIQIKKIKNQLSMTILVKKKNLEARRKKKRKLLKNHNLKKNKKRPLFNH